MKFDVAIIGGGPAGMMAGIWSSKFGAKVVLIEKNNVLGKKLLITGGGRCNITNININNKNLTKIYNGGKNFYTAFNKFNSQDVLNFFIDNGLKIKKEKNGRIFPINNRAIDIREVLVKLLKKYEVKILTNARVNKINKKNKKIKSLETSLGNIIADKFILCTGGKSYSQTGSSGDGFIWAEKLGHKINKLKPSLVPIILADFWIKEIQGISFSDVRIIIYYNKKKKFIQQGEIIFTHEGISGPAVYNLSRFLNNLDFNKIKLKIDFVPEKNFQNLDIFLRKEIEKNSKKSFKNLISKIVGNKLANIILQKLKIEENRKANTIKKEERRDTIRILKEMAFSFKELAGYEKAIITSGGIDFKEVSPRTLKSKIIDNLFFCGEILNIDGPSGGYNLQITWSTGYLVGQSVNINEDK